MTRGDTTPQAADTPQFITYPTDVLDVAAGEDWLEAMATGFCTSQGPSFSGPSGSLGLQLVGFRGPGQQPIEAGSPPMCGKGMEGS